MFEEMHIAGIIHKGISYDATAVSANDVLKMATINGAKALGLDDLGKIKKGYKADLILIDIDKPHFYPMHNVMSSLVYTAQGSDVDTVFVNGDMLYSNKRFTKIDIEKIKYNVNKVKQRIFINS
jgi:5-methylthioadenosine/S-adenosylhomocysteine deaminase